MVPKIDIDTRFAIKEDLPDILHLFAKGMRGYDAYPYRMFWKWKHMDNPFGFSPVLLGLHEGRIVGIRAFMRWKVDYSGKMMNVFRAVDTVTDSQYQGQGIFKKLTLSLIDHIRNSEPHSFIFNTPNKASRPGYLKMGWQVLGRAPVYLRFVPFAFSKREVSWNRLHELLNQFAVHDSKNSGQIESKVYVPKSLDYLQWRYQKYPIPDYGMDVADDRGIQYYFFLKIKNRGKIKELRICDVWSETQRNWGFIASHALKLARELGCSFVSLLPEPGNSLAMLRYGFVSVQAFANIITVRDINCGKSFNDFTKLRNWAFAMGDLELF